MATAKKASAPKTPAPTPAPKAASPAPAKKAAPAKKTAPAAKAPPIDEQTAAAPTKASAPAKKTPSKDHSVKQPTKSAPAANDAAAPSGSARAANGVELPAVKGVTKEGIAYTKDFDAKFLTAQRALLLTEREALTGQANRLEDEANQLIEESEMGDVQFDDEGGEGDTMVVERERDLALSAQARQTIADIDAALERLELGTYGYSVESGLPIARERLEAIPWAIVLVSEKVGGIGKR